MSSILPYSGAPAEPLKGVLPVTTRAADLGGSLAARFVPRTGVLYLDPAATRAELLDAITEAVEFVRSGDPGSASVRHPRQPAGAVERFEFGDLAVRTVLRDGNPWFVAADVCTVLDVARPQDSVRYLDDDEKGRCLLDTPSGQQQMLIVSEAGLYSLILRSRKPQARAFKRWVTHEVLPKIRRTGAYSPAMPGLSTPEGVAAMAERVAAAARQLAEEASSAT